MEEVWLYFYFFVFSSFKGRVKSILTQIDFFTTFFQLFFRSPDVLKILFHTRNHSYTKVRPLDIHSSITLFSRSSLNGVGINRVLGFLIKDVPGGQDVHTWEETYSSTTSVGSLLLLFSTLFLTPLHFYAKIYDL